MQTITIDILNNKALNLLKDLELLELIRLRRDISNSTTITSEWSTKYKGSMTKQRIDEIDYHLNELRKEWE